MKIDSHQHFWQYSPVEHAWISDSMAVLKQDFLPQNLQPELKAAGFDGCIAVQASQTEAETDFLLQLAAENPFIKGVVGWVELRANNAEDRISHFAKNTLLKGIRHVVQDEPDDEFMLQPDFLRGISYLQSFNLCYDILIYPKHLPVAAKLVERFPNQPFVLDHLAKPFIKDQQLNPWAEGIKALAKYPNVSCKLSGMVTEAAWGKWTAVDFKPYLDLAFEAFGPDRLMIGSDWPVCRLAATYAETMGLVMDYLQPFSEAERAKVLGGNATKVYKLC